MKKKIIWIIIGLLLCVYVGYAISRTLADAYISANKPLIATAMPKEPPTVSPEVTETVSGNTATPTPTPTPPALPDCISADEPGIRHIVLDEENDGRQLSLHLPETDSLEVSEAIRLAVFAQADAFAGEGFFASRYTTYRYNDQLISFAFTFTSWSVESGLAENRALLSFDLLGGLAVTPADMFALDYDFAAATEDVVGTEAVVDFTQFVFDAAQTMFLSQAADGAWTETAVPLSAYGDNWHADAYLLRYYNGMDGDQTAGTPDEPAGDKKYIAITFDDGPESTHTARLLDGLAEYNAKATFFVLGHRLGKTADLIERMIAEEHSVGSHTYSHVSLTSVSKSTIAYQMDETNTLLKAITGQDVTLLRPPYGNRNTQVAEMAGERGMSLILWSIDPQDWKVRDAKKIADHLIERAKDGEIILLHDIYGTTVDGALMAIKELTAQGYVFITVDELLEMNGGRVVGGMYRNGRGTAAQ